MRLQRRSTGASSIGSAMPWAADRWCLRAATLAGAACRRVRSAEPGSLGNWRAVGAPDQPPTARGDARRRRRRVQSLSRLHEPATSYERPEAADRSPDQRMRPELNRADAVSRLRDCRSRLNRNCRPAPSPLREPSDRNIRARARYPRHAHRRSSADGWWLSTTADGALRIAAARSTGATIDVRLNGSKAGGFSYFGYYPTRTAAPR